MTPRIDRARAARSPSRRQHRRAAAAATAGTLAAALVVLAGLPAQAGGGYGGGHGGSHHAKQPVLGTRGVPLITVDHRRFRDLDRNGRLTPYEDWRLSAATRAADLVGRMTLEQKAALLVHGTLPTSGTGYRFEDTTSPGVNTLVGDRHVTTFITRLSALPSQIAAANNAVQEAAEGQPLGIPVVVSTDPRNGFSVTEGQTVARQGVTAMPDAIGWAATDSPRLSRTLGDIVRQDYRAVGIQEGLSPQADIATEPRWTRINGTFGSSSADARDHVEAYVEGLQDGDHGLRPTSVATVTKHWVGYGAQDQGFDSHYYYGRFATFPGGNFAEHLVPFEGAFDAQTAGIMPTYSILEDLVYQGHAVEQTGAGFSTFLLQDLLRGQYGFTGVIVSDFGITGDCPAQCRATRPPASFIGPWGVGMPWGVEDLTVVQRYALAINAGVDQIGGSDDPSKVLAAVSSGELTAARVNQSAVRVLTQKFQLGLFENPYVSVAKADRIAGNARFQRVGDDAQARSLTLLTNAHKTLPVKAKKVGAVYLSGVSADVARAHGFTVTADLAQADLAIVRLSDPRAGADLTGLEWTGSEPDYQAFQAATAAGVPTIAVPKMDRPLILTHVADRAAAVLANYGVSDEVLLDTIVGKRSPGGKLPFELPSSMAAVEAQLGDVPDDSADPLFEHGFGLSYGKKHGGWGHQHR
ncbi:glycoside hydrolase family 3 protein [Cellulomonas edaphi]|uniref:beta-glucosidase n=1 Tax=Cellulomonas edaphi TaxID=3053468 RepID=A0ABT7S2R5_9CELL|nr:glycoside hydrolase family 3 N-terminal domain-containing protein [Cellulomons edaphi]MDM7829915.1 glycoside hydrolase family 3 N-terminal domain-containing protein [Cellulomons edaphi]